MAESKLPPLQAAVSSDKAARYAVRQGADELLLRLSGFAPGEAAALLGFCRLRGIKTVLDLAFPHTDKQLLLSAGTLKPLYQAGLDAVLCNTLGVLRLIRMEAPELPVHWAGVLNEGGLRFAAASGCVRAALAPGLSRSTMRTLFEGCAGLPLLIPVLSPGCPSVPDSPCYLTADSAIPGVSCGFGCRRRFGYAGKADEYPLYPRDISLLSRLRELTALAPAALGLDLPSEAPEQAALMVKTARDIWDDPGYAEAGQALLRAALHRPDATDAFFTGQKTGFTADGPPGDTGRHRPMELIQQNLENAPETGRVPVRFAFCLQPGVETRLAADDYEGHTVFVAGPEPAHMPKSFVTEAELCTRLYKTAGTPFVCRSAKCKAAEGYAIPSDIFWDMKSRVLKKLEKARLAPPERASGRFHPGVRFLPRREEPAITVRLTRMDQLSRELLELRPECVYLPLVQAVDAPGKLRMALDSKCKTVVELPRRVFQEDTRNMMNLLQTVYDIGVREVLVRHTDQLAMTAGMGFLLRTDLATANSAELRDLRKMKVKSAALSQGMTLSQIRELSHVMDTELELYGRLPLLHSRFCLIYQNRRRCSCEGRIELTDEDGRLLPLLRDSGHTTLLLDSAKLWLLPEKPQWKRIGLWAVRLSMTTENAKEVLLVTERHMGRGRFEPNYMSTGFYI